MDEALDLSFDRLLMMMVMMIYIYIFVINRISLCLELHFHSPVCIYGVQKATSLSFLIPNLDICSGHCVTRVVAVSKFHFLCGISRHIANATDESIVSSICC